MTRGSGARLLDWSGSKLHPIAPSDRENASLDSEAFFFVACLQHAFSVEPIDVSRSLRQQESTRPVAQQNAQPKPPSHIVSAMIERQTLFISIVDGLCTAKSINITVLRVELTMSRVQAVNGGTSSCKLSITSAPRKESPLR